jgi:uncharacterized membrane protein YdbT with pleckstrin-like domain
MPLVSCPDCKRQVSSEAVACPSCGYPIAARVRDGALAATIPTTVDTVLLEVRPSWWGFFWHLLFAWLVIPWLVALYRRHALVLRVYPDRVALERGVFTKEHREFFIKDIRSIDVDQTMLGRLVGVGDVSISTAATVDAAEQILGVPAPMRIKDLLISQRQTVAE